MEEKIIHRDAGFYAVVHFGLADKPERLPVFMKLNGLFTAEPTHAYVSSYRDDVETLACKRNRELEQEGHPLAGRVLPVHVTLEDISWREPEVKPPDNAHGLSFWWFTFGLAHPLAGYVQGVFASSEEKAREVMIRFYGHVWCSCYKTHTPIYQADVDNVRLGVDTYRALPKYLTEEDKYE